MVPETRLVVAAGVQVHVVEWGTPARPTVVLLHGGMAHARWWDRVAARLAVAFRVVAVDMPGHGDSPWLEPRRYGWALESAILRDLLPALAPGGYALGGHSHGALLAASATACGVATPVRLVLVDMPLTPQAPRLRRAGDRFRRIVQPRFATLEEGVATFRPFGSRNPPPRDVLEDVARASLRPLPEGGWTTKFDWRFFSEREAERPDESPFAAFPGLLREVRVPTLVVRGGASPILPADDAAAMCRLLPEAHEAVVPGAGHNPHLDDAATTADALRAFLAPAAGGQ